jgi:serine/threonine protein phosphatase PrpC
VSDKLKKKRGKESVASVVEELFDAILAEDIASSNGIGTDNMTCIVVEFKK